MASWTISRISSLLALVALAGCVTPPYVVPELELPATPVLPTVQAEEFRRYNAGELPAELEAELAAAGVQPPYLVMSLDVYRRLVVRDSLRKGYGEQLRAIIEAHNERAGE